MMLVSKIYRLVSVKNHEGRNLSKLIFNGYNRYKLILNQYITNITDTL